MWTTQSLLQAADDHTMVQDLRRKASRRTSISSRVAA